MRFSCEQCQTKYSIPDDRVRGKILKIRCKTCGGLIAVSEAGAKTTRSGDSVAEPSALQTVPKENEGGDATMVGGMADFLGKLGNLDLKDPDDWHLSVDGSQQGPLPLSNLAHKILEQAGTSAELYVWREGYNGWKAVEQVPEVKAAVEKARSSSKQGAPAAGAAKGAGSVSKNAPSVSKNAPSASKAAKPVTPAAPPNEGGDATMVGALDLPPEFAKPGKKPTSGGADEDVQDASMLMLSDEAFDALVDKGGMGTAAKPGGAANKAPPSMPKLPAAMSRTLPLGAKIGPLPSSLAPTPPPVQATPPPKPSPPVPAAPPATPPVIAPVATPAPPPVIKNEPAPPPVMSPSVELAKPIERSAQIVAPAVSPPVAQIVAMAEPPLAPPAAAAPMGGGFGNLALAPPKPTGMSLRMPIIAPPPPESESSAEQPKSRSWILGVVGLLLVVGAAGGGYWFVWKPRHAQGTVQTQLADGGGQDAGTSADGGSPPDGGTGAKKPEAKEKPDEELTGLSAEELKTILAERQAAVDKCTSKILKKQPELLGALMKIELTVTEKGKIKDASINGPDSNEKLGKCLLKVVKKIKYPKRDAEYIVRYPLKITQPEK